MQWLSRLDATKDPWFYFSYGNGLASHHRSWIDDTSLPLATIASYIERLEAGEAISRSRDALIAERDRITAEYRELMPESTRVTFDERLALARNVFPYVENHSFYVDHWYLTVFWNKVREFGALLASRRFLQGRRRRLLPTARRGARGTPGASTRVELGRCRRPNGAASLAGARRTAKVDV